MKQLHRSDLYGWSRFDEARNIDFNSVCWVRPEGNVLFDPMALSPHDMAHLNSLGGAKWIIITNSDHVREARSISEVTGAAIVGPKQEQVNFPVACKTWLSEGDSFISGLRVFELEGSKTPGELSFILEDTTLITGDLIRAHRPETLMLLPESKVADLSVATQSAKRFLDFPDIEVVLVGDGWSVFGQGYTRLSEMFK